MIIGVLTILAAISLVTFTFISSSSDQNRTSQSPLVYSNLPSPYPSPRYTIEAISPAEGKGPIDLTTPIVVTLSSPADNDVQLYIEPPIDFDRKISGNKLIFTPKTRYAPGTEYIYSIRFENQDYIPSSYAFRTSGSAISSLSHEVQSAPTELWEKNDIYNKEHRPDLYIKNKLPYANDFFVVRAELIDDPSFSYYQIVIEPKIDDEEVVRSEAQKWFEAIGLSEEQLSRVQVIYYF